MSGAMELLPSAFDEFRTEQYWEQFFKKRGHDNFEWYGDYGELCDIILKYAKPQENILVVGCGNSQLSSDMYEVGYHTQTNIDISDTVIKQMSDKNRDRDGMKFIRMDVFDMTFEDAEFSVVLDKSTLDAIMTNDSRDCHLDVDRMFGEIGRVLKFGGRYVCITLAQDHVIRKLVSHFTSIGWPVRVHKLQTSREAERDRDFYMPVFVLVMTKFKVLPDATFKILEIAHEDGSVSRVESEEKIYSDVKAYQIFGLVRSRITKRDVRDDQVCLTLHGPGATSPRYTLHIVDSDCKAKLMYGVFIVPQGRENEWLFCTDEGRLQLAQSAQSQRLVVVSLHRNHDYAHMQAIQDELSAKVMELAPAGLGTVKVPFMSVGDDIGLRKVQCSGVSETYGEWVVEDVTINGEVFRRLVHLTQPGFIQAEIRLIHSMRKKKGGRQLEPGKLVVDNSYLCVKRHVAMVAGLAFMHDFQKVLANEVDVMIIGDPCCVLTSYLRKTHQQMKLMAVPWDNGLCLEASKNWFGFVEDKLLRCCPGNALEILDKLVGDGTKKHVVICDLSSFASGNDELMAPPSSLLKEEVLRKFDSVLHPDGVFMLHVRRGAHTDLEETWRVLRSVFQVVLSKQLLDDVSTVVYAIPSHRSPQVSDANKHTLGQSLRRSVELLDSLTQKIHGTAEPNLIHMIENLSVH